MDFADDCVPADADLGGDLAAGQAGDDTVAELLDALRGPGGNTHDQAPFFVRPDLGRQQGESRACSFFEPSQTRGAVAADDGGQAPSFTERISA
jgi:hypothetical protein